MDRQFKKANVVISQCIEHGMCRYDGSQISSSFVKRLESYVNFLLVCPEVEIGLGIPREAVRVVTDGQNERLKFSVTGRDITLEMKEFCEKYLKNIKDKNVHGFILKNRSPTCGIKDVKLYKTIGKAPCIGKTEGFFGGLIDRHYHGIAIEDEGRLMNYNIRDHFLTQLFTLSEYDEIIHKKSMSKLVKFHSENKYLLMAYHQGNQKLLGKIVANHEKKAIEIVIEDYQAVLKKCFSNALRRGRNINMLMHLFGYFKSDLITEEKAYFLEILEQYSAKEIPFRVPLTIIYAWAIRYDKDYLKSQTIFSPYPHGILEVTDSGKGID